MDQITRTRGSSTPPPIQPQGKGKELSLSFPIEWRGAKSDPLPRRRRRLRAITLPLNLRNSGREGEGSIRIKGRRRPLSPRATRISLQPRSGTRYPMPVEKIRELLDQQTPKQIVRTLAMDGQLKFDRLTVRDGVDQGRTEWKPTSVVAHDSPEGATAYVRAFFCKLLQAIEKVAYPKTFRADLAENHANALLRLNLVYEGKHKIGEKTGPELARTEWKKECQSLPILAIFSAMTFSALAPFDAKLRELNPKHFTHLDQLNPPEYRCLQDNTSSPSYTITINRKTHRTTVEQIKRYKLDQLESKQDTRYETLASFGIHAIFAFNLKNGKLLSAHMVRDSTSKKKQSSAS